MGLYLVIVNIAMKLDNSFYKLIAIGLATEYVFQVFLTIGGQTKLIPMTGVTLPLVSYGGSSVMCTIFMLAIVQGLYVLRRDETAMDEDELIYDDEKSQKGQYDETQSKEFGKGSTDAGFDTDSMEKRIEEETKRSLYW